MEVNTDGDADEEDEEAKGEREDEALLLANDMYVQARRSTNESTQI